MKVQCPKCDHVFIATQDDEMCDIDITISDENFLAIAKKAHEQDITMNQFIINTLRKQMTNEDIKPYVENLHDQYTSEVDLQSGFTYVDWLEQKLYDNDVQVKE